MTQFDDILPEIGSCGLYQIAALILLSFVKFFPAFQTVSVVFTAGKMDFWCADDVNGSDVTVFSISNDSLNNCNQTCSSWTYSSDGQFVSTWRSQFNLVCDRQKLVNICSTLFMLGFLFGSTVYGMISDRLGRVPAACAAVLNTWLSGVLLSFSPSVEVYAALRFVVGFGASGVLSICNTLIAELVTSRHRLLFVQISSNGWNIAFCLLSLAAFAIREHWKLELVLVSPSIIAIGIVLLVGESPRWLLARNKPDKAFDRCKFIARINGHQLPVNFKEDVQAVTETLVEQQGTQPEASIIDLLRSRMLRPTLLVWNNFFSSSLVYYGLILSVGKLKGNIFLIFLLGSAVGIPSSIFSIFAARAIGRPLLFCFLYLMSSIIMLSIGLLWERPDCSNIIVVLAIAGRFFASASFCTSWGYSGEIFPTLVRNTGMGSSSTIARIGGILAPIINLVGEFWPPLPFLIFAAVSLMASLLALLLPETKNKRLAETLQDADKQYTATKISDICSTLH